MSPADYRAWGALQASLVGSGAQPRLKTDWCILSLVEYFDRLNSKFCIREIFVETYYNVNFIGMGRGVPQMHFPLTKLRCCQSTMSVTI